MYLQVFDDHLRLTHEAAAHTVRLLQDTLSRQPTARVVLGATPSQFDFLEALVDSRDVAWDRVEVFHLAEYVGLGIGHAASRRKALLDRFLHRVAVREYHLLDGEVDPVGTARRVGSAILTAPVDVACLGIGDDGHLALNDPPADFEAKVPYRILRLEPDRRQRLWREGTFPALADVPTKAISITVPQLMQAKAIIAVVPGGRKAEAARNCLRGHVCPMRPASLLQEHRDVTVFLDRESASRLDEPEANAA